MQELDNPFSSKEVVEKLSIGDSTLRKWALALEEQNYNFVRTTQNKRLFSDKDIFVLSQFKILVQDKNLSITNAAAIIAAKYSDDILFENGTEKEQYL
ncbi:MerR family transcriptional regulator [Peribacillus loiseleuriae]|uniref:MerR family transcriptional regulator n=1 Tax=Peribacillus loiseleuriae TaxID=1679170 RepID=UPI0037F8DBFB